MAKENCFENAPHESLDFCPNQEVKGGVSVRLLYIPEAFVDRTTLPDGTGDLASRITIADGGIVLKADKGFKGIDVMVDENELKSTLVGNKGNKKSKAELEVYIPGFNAKTIAFVDSYKNAPAIYAIADANGTIWVIGTKLNPAYLDSADGTTGKKYEDNSGIAVKISANTKLYKYAGEIVEVE